MILGANAGYEEIGFITNSVGHKIMICGYKEGVLNQEDTADSDPAWLYKLHSNFIIHDCKTGDTLFMIEQPAPEYLYQIKTSEKEIKVIAIAILRYSGFENNDPPLPVNSITISLKGNRAFVSEARPLFHLPVFSPLILDSAAKFYNRLEDTLKVKKAPAEWIDYNQFPGDLLLIAALNNIGRSAELYRNLKKYFGLDGALSEDYDAGYLDYLLSNIPKNK